MFAQTFANHTPIRSFIVLSTTESTNNYAMAKLHAGMVNDGCCFIAVNQTSGRGQRGKQWISKPGENITMSTVFQPSGTVPSNITAFPFVFSASIALGCYDFIKEFELDELSIKWPNDLYVGDRKAAGILIENVFRGKDWWAAVSGTGININQQLFPAVASNPVSISQLTGKRYNVLKLGKALHRSILGRYERLFISTREEIMEEYNLHLYKRNQQVKLKRNNIVFHATIKHVTAAGSLVVQDAVEHQFASGEIEFV